MLWTAILAASATASPVAQRQADNSTAIVHLQKTHGSASALGSGFIYGFPDNGTSVSTAIPSHFVTDIGFRTCRAGGAQTDAKGWSAGGIEGYQGRFDSALSNYRTTRFYGGDFILLPHDIWGADGGQGSNAIYPGDDGNWTSLEAFYTRLAADMKAADMTAGMTVDLWNEPDLDLFWNRTWDQYLEYWQRSFTLVRSLLPEVEISGPAMAHSPNLSDTNWQTWMQAVSAHNTVPDRYSWHQIGEWEREPDTTIPDFNTLRSQAGLPERPIDVNEYAWPTEQNPGTSAWYLSQLERHDIRGLRANWGSGSGLHDFMANLIANTTKGEYYPNGEWQLYKYYAGMKGERLETEAAGDLLFDVFGTVGEKDEVKIIVGSRTVQAEYEIVVEGFGQEVDVVDVRTWRFDWKGLDGEVDGPVDLGVAEVQVMGGSMTLVYDPPDNATAYAYEFST